MSASNTCTMATLLAATAIGAVSGAAHTGTNHKAAVANSRMDAAAAASLPKCIYTKEWEPVNNPAILIPLYTVDSPVPLTPEGECGHKMFLDVAKGCRAVLAVVNPATGPRQIGHPEEPNVRKCMKMLDEHNVTMVGYVHTKVAHVNRETGVWSTTGMRDKNEVRGDMDTWLTTAQGMSNFRGFFFDDTTNYFQTGIGAFGIDHIAWYRDLVNIAKGKLPHAKIVLNPGSFVDMRLMKADPAAGYPEAAEVTIPFEDYAWKWRPEGDDCCKAQYNCTKGQFAPGPWCPNVPGWDGVEPFKDAVFKREIQASAVIHSASKEFLFRERKTAHAAGLRYFYAADIPLVKGPWGRVPEGWDEYLSTLDAEETKDPRPATIPTVAQVPQETSAAVQKPSSANALSQSYGSVVIAVTAALFAAVL